MTDIAQGGGSSWSPERSAAGGHSPYLIAFVVSIATFMEVLDTTIANVALRHIAGGLAVERSGGEHACGRGQEGCRRPDRGR